MQLSPKIVHIIRLWTLLLAVASVLLVVMTSIPGVVERLGMQQFLTFLTLALLTIILIDIAAIDMVRIYIHMQGKNILFASIALFVLLALGMGLRGQTLSLFHMMVYICFLLGIFVFLREKHHYMKNTVTMDLRGIVSSGSSMVAIFLSMACAFLTMSLGTRADVNCQTLQRYTSEVIAVADVSQWFQSQVAVAPTAKLSPRQRLKKEYIDDLLQERKLMSQNACDVMFAQITTKISDHQRTVHTSLILLLFFFFWPFLVFFLWIEAVLAYIVLW
jgi:hypothetical protein